ncbi:MAG: hypothetical protein BVN35_18325 [Proteobacteria bacterium ST_bin11]|nr:MAG: hypothetical protein BVN35_18325 [Proteobacteria bacterium ST_bin11]
MKKNILAALAITLAGFLSIQNASAHVGWVGRDLMTDATSSTVNPNGSTTYVYDRGNVTSNYGWADGLTGALAPNPAFNDQGDSHRVRFTKFYLGTTSFVDVTAFAQNFSRNTADNNTVTRLGDLKPGFSIYSGSGTLNNPLNPTTSVYEAWRDHDLVPQAVHDWAVNPNAAALGFEGSFNANGNITMGNNNGQVNTQNFTGHLAWNQTGSSVSLSNLVLGPGWYSVVVGGSLLDGIEYLTNPAATHDPNIVAGTTFPYLGAHAALDNGIRGFGVELTVRPVPVPGAVWLFGSAIAGLIGFGRRKAA